MVPRIDARALIAADPQVRRAAGEAALETGFMVLTRTPFEPGRMAALLEAYRDFFRLPEAEKARVDMARTGSNRGWGAIRSEQVDPGSNPDLKEVFDCGYEWPGADAAGAPARYYAPNLWPAAPERFRTEVEGYYRDALAFCRALLGALAEAIGAPRAHFDAAFLRPMALLRGNYYPARPDWAGARDFGIAPHTDYGCLTLLATDGAPGLEVLLRDGSWEAVQAEPGEFVINFGEMLEMWTAGRVRATLHRVRGGARERLSVPLFFNPQWDANVAPPGAAPIRAGDHLARRYDETYVHLQAGA